MPQQPPSAAKSKLSVRIAATCLAIALSLAIVEGALWAFFPTPFHQWMAWQPDGYIQGRGRPNHSFETAAGHEVRINRLGFRGPDPAWQPRPRTLRILTFGGSSTFNYHAEGEAATWPSLLQDLLRKALDIDVEVVNLALPGFNAVNSKINYMVTGRQLNAHVAIVYHTWNDLKKFRLFETDRTGLILADAAKNKPLWQEVARRFQISRLIRNAHLRWSTGQRETFYASLEGTGSVADRMPAADAFRWAEANFTDFARLARGDGLLPVLVSQATIVVPENLDRPEYRRLFRNQFVGMTSPVVAAVWQRMRDIIEGVAKAEAGVFVDGYRAVPPDLRHMTDEVHFTREGRERLAAAIAEALLGDPAFGAVVRRVRDRTKDIAAAAAAPRPD